MKPTVYGVAYKPTKRCRKWRLWFIFRTVKSEIDEEAEEWWGPNGHDLPYKVVPFTSPKGFEILED